jgi:hypothetical protein
MKPILLVLSAAVWLHGCCFPARKEPQLPKDVVGWKDFQEDTTKLRGRFLLKSGESTDNGKLRIKVLELIPPDCMSEAGSFEHRARVRLQFESAADRKVLCTGIFPENGGGNLTLDCAAIPHEFFIFGIGVGGINLKDGWVSFILIGDYQG